MRRVWIAAIIALGLVACSGAEPIGDELADRLHRNAIVIDGHADTTPRFEDPTWRFDERHDATETHVDLPRLREGGVDAQFWSIYLPEQKIPGRAIREALGRIDAVHRMVARHDDVVLATSAADVRHAAATGRFASLMGVEGGHIIEESLEVLRTYQRLGVRYLTLTHSFHIPWADSSGTTEALEPEKGGLTEFGEEVVAELNRLGVLVDISHVADDTFWDTIRITRAPVIASHSSCRGVYDHPRNLSDDMLRALASNGGVAMLNFYSAYIDPDANEAIGAWFKRKRNALDRIYKARDLDMHAKHARSRAIFAEDPPPRAPLDVLLDHFDHAIRVAGADHVGLGSDWDGVVSMPEGLGDVSRLPVLTRGLLERGHSPATVDKVLGGNVLRVMERAERVARAIAAE